MEGVSFSIKEKTEGKVSIFCFSGALNCFLPEKFNPLLDKSLNEGFEKFIFDFEGVSTVDSPAIACILSATEKIVDDSEGILAVSGLNDMYRKVFEMVGIFLYSVNCQTLSEAIAEIKD